MGRAEDTVRKRRFGAPPDATDPADRLRQIHELSAPPPARPGMREITPREREIYIAALEMIDAEGKARKAAEQELAEYKAGKVVPGAPVSESLSYRGTIAGRDAAGDFKTIDLTPSDAGAQAWRIKIVGRDAAAELRSFDLIPVERAAT